MSVPLSESVFPVDEIVQRGLRSYLLHNDRPSGLRLLTYAATHGRPDIHFRLGTFYARSGHTSLSISHFLECVALGIRLNACFSCLGSLYYHRREYGKSFEFFSRGTDSVCLYETSKMLFEKGRRRRRRRRNRDESESESESESSGSENDEEENEKEAYELLQRSANLGYSKAIRRLIEELLFRQGNQGSTTSTVTPTPSSEISFWLRRLQTELRREQKEKKERFEQRRQEIARLSRGEQLSGSLVPRYPRNRRNGNGEMSQGSQGSDMSLTQIESLSMEVIEVGSSSEEEEEKENENETSQQEKESCRQSVGVGVGVGVKKKKKKPKRSLLAGSSGSGSGSEADLGLLFDIEDGEVGIGSESGFGSGVTDSATSHSRSQCPPLSDSGGVGDGDVADGEQGGEVGGKSGSEEKSEVLLPPQLQQQLQQQVQQHLQAMPALQFTLSPEVRRLDALLDRLRGAYPDHDLPLCLRPGSVIWAIIVSATRRGRVRIPTIVVSEFDLIVELPSESQPETGDREIATESDDDDTRNMGRQTESRRIRRRRRMTFQEMLRRRPSGSSYVLVKGFLNRSFHWIDLGPFLERGQKERVLGVVPITRFCINDAVVHKSITNPGGPGAEAIQNAAEYVLGHTFTAGVRRKRRELEIAARQKARNRTRTRATRARVSVREVGVLATLSDEPSELSEPSLSVADDSPAPVAPVAPVVVSEMESTIRATPLPPTISTIATPTPPTPTTPKASLDAVRSQSRDSESEDYLKPPRSDVLTRPTSDNPDPSAPASVSKSPIPNLRSSVPMTNLDAAPAVAASSSSSSSSVAVETTAILPSTIPTSMASVQEKPVTPSTTERSEESEPKKVSRPQTPVSPFSEPLQTQTPTTPPSTSVTPPKETQISPVRIPSNPPPTVESVTGIGVSPARVMRTPTIESQIANEDEGDEVISPLRKKDSLLSEPHDDGGGVEKLSQPGRVEQRRLQSTRVSSSGGEKRKIEDSPPGGAPAELTPPPVSVSGGSSLFPKRSISPSPDIPMIVPGGWDADADPDESESSDVVEIENAAEPESEEPTTKDADKGPVPEITPPFAVDSRIQEQEQERERDNGSFDAPSSRLDVDLDLGAGSQSSSEEEEEEEIVLEESDVEEEEDEEEEEEEIILEESGGDDDDEEEEEEGKVPGVDLADFLPSSTTKKKIKTTKKKKVTDPIGSREVILVSDDDSEEEDSSVSVVQPLPSVAIHDSPSRRRAPQKKVPSSPRLAVSHLPRIPRKSADDREVMELDWGHLGTSSELKPYKLISLGTISPNRSFHTYDFIYPVGFLSIFLEKGTGFALELLDDGGRPLFVFREFAPDRRTVTQKQSGHEIYHVWANTTSVIPPEDLRTRVGFADRRLLELPGASQFCTGNRQIQLDMQDRQSRHRKRKREDPRYQHGARPEGERPPKRRRLHSSRPETAHPIRSRQPPAPRSNTRIHPPVAGLFRAPPRVGNVYPAHDRPRLDARRGLSRPPNRRRGRGPGRGRGPARGRGRGRGRSGRGRVAARTEQLRWRH